MARQEPRGGGVRGSIKQAAGVGGMGRHDDGVAGVEMGGGGRSTTDEEEEEEKQAGATWVCWALVAGVTALGLAGGGVLLWWAVAFHPAHQQLWMVPVGLVLLGTPLVAWLSLFASGACRRLGRLRVGAGADQPPLAMAGR